jgi:hypothetical protein
MEEGAMKLVRFGNRVLNMGCLVEAVIFDASVSLRFATPEGGLLDGEAEIRPYNLALYGAERDAFMRWMMDNCEVASWPQAVVQEAPDDIPF